MEIGVDMCIAGRDLTEPKLSPDGSTVAFVVRWEGATAIVVVPVDGGPERLVTTHPAPAPGRGLGGGCFDWNPDGTAIAYAARDGDVWLQPVPGGAARPITAFDEGRRAEAPVFTPDGAAVLAVIDQAELWSLPTGGDGARVAPTRLDDGGADFVFDPSVTADGGAVMWTAWNVPDMPWDAARIERRSLIDGARSTTIASASAHQPRVRPGGGLLSVRDDTGWLNVWLDDEPLVDESFEHAGPSWGMGQRSYAASPDGTRLAFTRNEAGFGRLCVADLGTGAITEVARGVHGQLTWVGDRLVALRTGARTPTQVVVYDTATWNRTTLAVGPVAGWDAIELPEPEPFVVAHDGVDLHARRYVAGEGRSICWVHGGPTDQWQVEFMPRVAYWWSRGWDVVVPDPRGTTGHGRAYQQALHGEWGRLDVDDTAAILRRHHSDGRGTPDRTVIMGSSSGGLTALGVLARHPGLAAGGVVRYPVADLSILATASHRFEAHYTLGLVGPLSDEATYRDRSPITDAVDIAVPLLVMHGDSDPVVPLASTLDLVERMRNVDRDVELVVYEGEGHGFRDPDHQRDEYRRTGEFLTRVVGGR